MICNILPKRTIMECISYSHIFLMEFIHGGDIFVISKSVCAMVPMNIIIITITTLKKKKKKIIRFM